MRTRKISSRAALGAAGVVAVFGLAACGSTTADDSTTEAATPPAATTSAPASSAPTAEVQNAAVAGSYITLDEYEDNKAKYADTDVVLFFNASWCPTCQAANKSLDASKGDFPNGLTVVSVDYDSNTELRKEYGVTTQHTFVLIDSDGNEVKKWTGSESVEEIEAKV